MVRSPPSCPDRAPIEYNTCRRRRGPTVLALKPLVDRNRSRRQPSSRPSRALLPNGGCRSPPSGRASRCAPRCFIREGSRSPCASSMTASSRRTSMKTRLIAAAVLRPGRARVAQSPAPTAAPPPVHHQRPRLLASAGAKASPGWASGADDCARRRNDVRRSLPATVKAPLQRRRVDAGQQTLADGKRDRQATTGRSISDGEAARARDV